MISSWFHRFFPRLPGHSGGFGRPEQRRDVAQRLLRGADELLGRGTSTTAHGDAPGLHLESIIDYNVWFKYTNDVIIYIYTIIYIYIQLYIYIWWCWYYYSTVIYNWLLKYYKLLKYYSCVVAVLDAFIMIHYDQHQCTGINFLTSKLREIEKYVFTKECVIHEYQDDLSWLLLPPFRSPIGDSPPWMANQYWKKWPLISISIKPLLPFPSVHPLQRCYNQSIHCCLSQCSRVIHQQSSTYTWL